ncbi:hypothetical protein [Sabulicella rubraurantiaca]|uniref:hypothetical protein n=1 Tax=Sabulicella rubraurantiaca TaxID=2811429 RepID=UPI001A96F094|nr:hypothetical protein [Sabulicella rubraurantiaca]
MSDKGTRVGETMLNHASDESAGTEPSPVRRDWLTDALTRVKLFAVLLFSLGLLLLMASW